MYDLFEVSIEITLSFYDCNSKAASSLIKHLSILQVSLLTLLFTDFVFTIQL